MFTSTAKFASTTEEINSHLAAGVQSGAYPSATLAVGIGNRTLLKLCAGDATLQTRFDMASLTKVVSTTMLSLLSIESGRLTLADTLSMHFDAPPDKAAITVEQLLTHTAGFLPHIPLEDSLTDPADVLSFLLSHPLAAPPDGTPRYSCMGFIVLGKLLECIWGAPLDVLAARHVFAPLGMHSTGYLPTGDNIAKTEICAATGRAFQGIVHDENARFQGGISGNAGVFSDISDMCTFASMLATGGSTFLSPAMLDAATRNRTKGHDAHRGLGFHLGGIPGSFFGDLFPDTAFGHTGFTGTSLVVDKHSGLFVVLLTNRVYPTRDNDRHLRHRRALHNLVYARMSPYLSNQ